MITARTASAEEFARELLAEEVERPVREMIELLETAPDCDIAQEVSSRFAGMLQADRDLLVLDQQYWLDAMRDPDLGGRYADRLKTLHSELDVAIRKRLKRLRLPSAAADGLAMVSLCLLAGATRHKLAAGDVVADDTFATALGLLWTGALTRTGTWTQWPEDDSTTCSR